MRSRNQSAHFDTHVGPGHRGARRRGGRSLFCQVLLAAALGVAPGCQLNRSFFQMDSDSRVPFFGIDLAPGWARRDSAVDGVSRLQSEPREQAQSAATARSEATSPKSLTLPLSESVVSATAVDGAPAENFR